MFFNNGYSKLTTKEKKQVNNQFKLITSNSNRILRNYQNQGFGNNADDKRYQKQNSIYNAMSELPPYVTITLINDINYGINVANSDFIKRWISDTYDKNRFDVVDLIVIMKCLEYENNIVFQLNNEIYKDISSSNIQKNIVDLIFKLVCFIDGISESVHIDIGDGKGAHYTWGDMFNSQLLTSNWLIQRFVELMINGENKAYTNFNGSNTLINKMLPFTGQEETAKNINNKQTQQKQPTKNNKDDTIL